MHYGSGSAKARSYRTVPKTVENMQHSNDEDPDLGGDVAGHPAVLTLQLGVGTQVQAQVCTKQTPAINQSSSQNYLEKKPAEIFNSEAFVCFNRPAYSFKIKIGLCSITKNSSINLKIPVPDPRKTSKNVIFVKCSIILGVRQGKTIYRTF